MNKDILIYSFHTNDDYYTGKANQLKARLDALGLPYRIDGIDIPEGKEWPDICREKIGMIKKVCDENPDKKVFWIDVDCYLIDLPDYVAEFSADIIGFQRGFSTPDMIGYAGRSRFWEPCFWGINTSRAAREFIDDAHAAEQAFSDRATDDYFFEESWRKNGSGMSFQIIPSITAARTEEAVVAETFFVFGASGNVAKFKGKVSQHSSLLPESAVPINARVKRRLKEVGAVVVPERFKPFVKRALGALKARSMSQNVTVLTEKSLRIQVIKAAKEGNASRLDSLGRFADKGSGSGQREKTIYLGKSMCAYRYSAQNEVDADPLKLGWWIDPAPGNFGDWLAPYIFRELTGRGVEYVNPRRGSSEYHYLAVGSIGKFATPTSILMGVGVSRKDAVVNPEARILSLRGPRTGAVVKASGGEDPEIYGDPAILLPRIFTPGATTKSGKVGLIRHFTHLGIDLKLPSYMEEISIFASSPKDVEAFIAKLHEFDYVISSAMHGFIVCQAYGIPCALVSFKGGESFVHGDGMKYKDYFEGVGLAPRSPDVIPTDLCSLELQNLVSKDAISSERVDILLDMYRTELSR
ncbi:polysaccharide pyruvyl transferase family protein [Marinobacter daepoensis]|uniref:polysaccharide pyruvyl transferase family protein n=1 Tax=Marinobacter daepoensis TaxID=262077 RepID=UPI000421D2B3|nr:polysaccharide pyruvyl transferase family protein [Marinobacter daepoensis]